MRIWAIADIHGVLPIYEWLVDSAKQHQADAVVIAGDLFAGDLEEGQQRQAAEIVPILQRLPMPCYYLMGNDDNVSLGYEDERIQPLHGRKLVCAGQALAGYEYTPPFVGQRFVKREKEIARDLRALESLWEPQAVLVTHTPALGTLDCVAGSEHVGSRAVAEFLRRRPMLAHIHGPIHSAFGREGNHFNVAAAGQRRAIVIELPSLRHAIVAAE